MEWETIVVMKEYRASGAEPFAHNASHRDAIRVHNTPRCFLGSSPGLEEFPDVRPTPEESEDTEANTLRSVG